MQKSHRKFAGFKKTPYLCTRLTAKRSGFSAVGSAHVWGARGRWFESSNPDRSEGVDNKEYQLLFFFSPIFTSFGATDGNRDENRHLKRHLWTPDR